MRRLSNPVKPFEIDSSGALVYLAVPELINCSLSAKNTILRFLSASSKVKSTFELSAEPEVLVCAISLK